MNAQPLSVKDKIKGARRARRTKQINLRGDLVAELERLDEKLNDQLARERDSSAPGRMHQPKDGKPGTLESARIAQQIKDLEAEMEDNWLELTFEHQGFDAWEQWKDQHPPKDDDETDKYAGCNFDALMNEYMPRCLVEPELDSEDWANLRDKCSPGDIKDAAMIVFVLHTRELNVPKSRLASATLLRKPDDSEQLVPGE